MNCEQYELKELGNGLWAYELGYVRSYLLVGTERALLIDTAMGEFDWAKALARVTTLPVTAVNTHGHEDHCCGDGQFDDVYIDFSDLQKARDYGGMEKVRFHPLHDGQRFELGGITVETIRTPGHTLGSVSFLDMTHRRLFTGDLVNSGAVIMARDGGEYLTELYRDSMRMLSARRDAFDAVYSDHNDYPLPAGWLGRLADCAGAVMDGGILGEDYHFQPDGGLPALEGVKYTLDGVSLLYIQSFPAIAQKEGFQWGSDRQYRCYDVHMRYQAGYAQMQKWTSGSTMHGGIGWFHPFGMSRYYCGEHFAEAADFPLEHYFSPYWQREYDTSLFCIYRLEDGDIYAYDGVFAVRDKGIMEIPFDSVMERRDVVVNLIVGGTGAYEGAMGIMIGTAEGAGEVKAVDGGEELPEALIKDLQGYMKVPVRPEEA